MAIAATQVRLSARAVLLSSLLITLLIYLPGISGGFAFDDYANILANDNLRPERLTFGSILQAGWSGSAGPLKRPLPMMSFAINFATTGGSAAAFKFTNLAIHLTNGILLFVLLRSLLSAKCRGRGDARPLNAAMVAAAASAIWLVHPLNLTSVLYVVQRMNSLAALFSLAAMICYCSGRGRLERGSAFAWPIIGGGAGLFVGLGLLCKENAVLSLPLMVLVEACFFRLRTARPVDRTILIGVLGVIVVLPIATVLIYLASPPDFLAAHYARRSFTRAERMLTESRALWFYLSVLLLPRLGRLGLHHDDFVVSTSLAEPAALVAVVGIVGALIAAVLALRRYPMLTFAIGWFLIAHALESTIIPLELVYEHRNYVPAMGIVFALCYGVSFSCRAIANVHLPGLIWLAAMLACGGLTTIRAAEWGDPVTLAALEARRHPQSFRAVYDLGRIQFDLYQRAGDERHYARAVANFERAAMLDPSTKRPLATLLKIEDSRGRAPRPEWYEELQRRYRTTLFRQSDSLDLHQFVKCRAEGTCNFADVAVVELYRAALSNPTAAPYSKAQLMVDLAMFHVNETNDRVRAMALLDDAVELFPDEFGFRKIRAQIYLMAGRYADVEDEIRHLRSVTRWRDRLRSPARQIDAIEQQLGAAQTGRRVEHEPATR